ncbi:MAG: drug/metabolite transporter (DMT)-like permease [Oceanicoccus sp.]|jgi:drug/metabolite transporter (DMT)-like permease
MSNTLRAHFALLIAMTLWGSSFIALKIAVTDMPPMIVVFLRMLVASITFIVLAIWLRPRIQYQAGDWRYLLGMAFFEPCLYFLFEAKALQYTSAGQAGMVTSLLPLMVAVAAFFIFKERNTLKQWLGFLVALSGVLWMSLTTQESDQASNALLGNFLELMAMVTAVGYTLLVKHLVQRYNAFVLTAMQSFMGAIFFFPLAIMSDWPEKVALSSMGMIVYLGIVITLGAYGLYNYSLKFVKTATAAAYVNLLPVTALLFSMLLLGERLVMQQWLAIVVIFIGVYFSREPKALKDKDKDIPPAITG